VHNSVRAFLQRQKFTHQMFECLVVVAV